MIDDPDNRKLGEETLEDNRIKSDGVTMGDIKQIEITASNFKFEPDSFTVNVGDTVTISFKNTEGFHDFAIDEFKVKSKTIEAGAVEQITFVADKKGTFQFYCSIGQHKAMGMVGTLVVN
jgi:nitrosocyanin